MRKAKLYALTLAAVMAVGSAPVYTYGSPAEEPRKSRKHRKMRMGRHLPQSQRHRKGKKSLRQHREQVLRLRQVPRPLH